MKLPASAHPASTPDLVDWSQLCYPGPRRVFTPDEMARAGTDAPARTLLVTVAINAALLAFALLQMAPPTATARLTALFIGMAVAAHFGALALWRQPTRQRLLRLTLGYAAFNAALLVGIRWRIGADAQWPWIFGSLWGMTLVVTVGWWVLTLYRAHQIEGRLRELAERDRAVALAGQLMAAQIQPHFLFNSLASLQHWVHTGDPRAAPLLDALTGFLRATLPLFNRAQLTLGEELQAVRHYLVVMQARLGDRLRFRIELPDALLPLWLPPGLLLTLVENAVEHGVQPSLAGAEVHLHGELRGDAVCLWVDDSGAGLAPGQPEGVGLANSRARLAQAWGDASRLDLQARPEGGCRATLRLPRAALPGLPATP